MSDATDAGGRYPDRPGEPPEEHVTINQIVARNVAFFRKAAGLTQEELGAEIGWSKAIVSAAERSWDSTRVRHFTVDDVASLAAGLGVPILAFFLPPADDGQDRRYVVCSSSSAREMTTGEFFRYIIPEGEPSGDVRDRAAAEAYDERMAAAVSAYLGVPAGEAMKARLRDMATDSMLAGFLDHARESRVKLAEFAEALPGVIQDNDVMQDILSAAIAQLRREHGQQQKEAGGSEGGNAERKAGDEGLHLQAMPLPRQGRQDARRQVPQPGEEGPRAVVFPL